MKRSKIKKKIKAFFIYLSMITAFLLFLYLVNINVISVIFVAILIVIASLSKIYKRFTSISLGFELMTPVVIIIAYKFGALIAIEISLPLIVATEFISGNMNPRAILFQFAAYVIISIIASSLSSINFVTVAIILVIFRNIFLFLCDIFLSGTDIARAILSNVPNVFINSFILSSIGTIIVNLL